MKALPVLIEDSPMYNLVSAELPYQGRIYFQETSQRYDARVRRKIVKAIRGAQRLQRQLAGMVQ